MPELPEVETTARYLNKKVSGRVIRGLWTDWPKYLRPVRSSRASGPQGTHGGTASATSDGMNSPEKNEELFRKILIGRRIVSVGRRAKNILFRLSGGHLMLVHQKMTGHLLVGKWRERTGKEEEIWLGQKWVPVEPGGPLGHDRNRFIRLIFFLGGGEMLALSDLRRFAKLVLGPEGKILGLKELKELGPEPVEPGFTFSKFAELFKNKKGKIKQVLLDQNFISGVGNIYADEALWHGRIHPLRRAEDLSRIELRRLYNSLRRVLWEAIRLKGSSVDDYRTPSGRPGFYQEVRRVYHREGEGCRRCGTKIKRIKLGQRSAHFCPTCQPLRR